MTDEVEHVVRVYIWMKVVAVDASVRKGTLVTSGLDLLQNRIPIKSATGTQLPFFMAAGMAPILETARHGDQPMMFSFNSLPPGTSLEAATAWISSADGVEWRSNAAAWILVYGVAGISST